VLEQGQFNRIIDVRRLSWLPGRFSTDNGALFYTPGRWEMAKEPKAMVRPGIGVASQPLTELSIVPSDIDEMGRKCPSDCILVA
jgi:hypothetical protein